MSERERGRGGGRKERRNKEEGGGGGGGGGVDIFPCPRYWQRDMLY
jgi:hypothetical protein